MRHSASLLHGLQNAYAGCLTDFGMEYSAPERSVITVISVSVLMLHGFETPKLVSTYILKRLLLS